MNQIPKNDEKAVHKRRWWPAAFFYSLAGLLVLTALAIFIFARP
ncbi:hypothetical protein [Henriciella sp.]|nr:hypothetical protein [Henriciella sp.]